MPEVTRLKKVAVLGRESTLSPLGHVALPRRREHEASTDTDVSPFHSSNPFAMIDITSSDQLGCIMSFPHGQHRLRHAPRTNHSALDEGEEKKKKKAATRRLRKSRLQTLQVPQRRALKYVRLDSIWQINY